MEQQDIGEIPDGWFVLWCDRCFASLMWTVDITTQYDTLDEWFETTNWAAYRVEHGDHS